MSERTKSFLVNYLLKGDLLFYLICLTGIIGIFYSRALLSIFISGSAILALLQLGPKKLFKEMISSKLILFFSGITLIYLLSYFNSVDTETWFIRTKTNISFCLIPIGILTRSDVSRNTWLAILLSFITVSCVSISIVISDYLFNFETYNELYKVGKTIPTPIFHPRYSYVISLAALLACYLLSFEEIAIKGHVFLQNKLKYIVAVLAIILVVCLHVLAIRNGIVSFYVGFIVMIFYGLMKLKKGKLLLYILPGIVIFSMLSLSMFPTLKNKMAYSIWDMKMYLKHGPQGEYSDNIRIVSFQNGFTLFKGNPVFGVGIGDVYNEMNQLYKKNNPNFPVSNYFAPIGQYIFILTSFGIIGFLFYFFFLFSPLILYGKGNVILWSIYASLAVNFLIENTIELQIGKAVIVFLICATIMFKKTSKEPVVTT